MNVDAKIVKRINNLVSLANSSEFKGERENAALEAVKLLHLHKVPIGYEPPRAPKRRVSAQPPPIRVMANWVPSFARKDLRCDICKEVIYEGEECWESGTGRYIHIDWPCED